MLPVGRLGTQAGSRYIARVFEPYPAGTTIGPFSLAKP